MRELLALRLKQCPTCNKAFEEGVAFIAPDEGVLTEQQIADALTYIGKVHLDHSRLS